MQFLNHDYYSNFEGAVKSGDVDLTIDLWVNEVSDLIMSEAGKVISLLNKVGIKTEDNVSDEEIVDAIMANIGSNSQLNKGISFLIAELNGMMNNDKDWKTKVDNIAATYKTLLDKTLTNPTTSGSIKNDIMKQIKSKADAKGDYTRIIFKQEAPVAAIKKRNKKALCIVGGLIVLTAIGIGIYYYMKNKKAKSLLSVDGGNLDPLLNGTQIPIANAPIPAPVVNANIGMATGGNVLPSVAPNVTPTAVVTPTPVVSTSTHSML